MQKEIIMKKRKLYIFLTAVVVTLSAILLTGCNGGGNTPPTEKWISMSSIVKEDYQDEWNSDIGISGSYSHNGIEGKIDSWSWASLGNIEEDFIADNVKIKNYVFFDFLNVNRKKPQKVKFSLTTDRDYEFTLIYNANRSIYEDEKITFNCNANVPQEVVLDYTQLVRKEGNSTAPDSFHIYLELELPNEDVNIVGHKINMRVGWKISNMQVVL